MPLTTDNIQPVPIRTMPEVSMAGSDGLWDWLNASQISLGFTTYQTNRLFLIGCKPEGGLAVNERLFDKPMGLYAHNDNLYMACRYQIWQLENRLEVGEVFQGCDRLYVPSISHTTGDLNVHDVVVDKNQKLHFINTDFSCLATLRAGFNFEPIWQPPFISKMVAEDRCHLNGLALQGGEPVFATACSCTDMAAGWRNHRVDGGIVMHIPSNEIIAGGLSMPHSPRWYRGKLWLLNSGQVNLDIWKANSSTSGFLSRFCSWIGLRWRLCCSGFIKIAFENLCGSGFGNPASCRWQNSSMWVNGRRFASW